LAVLRSADLRTFADTTPNRTKMAQFIVSARKYRPQRFEDVVGQAHVSQTLKNALQSGHLAHAFLFCGPRGVGKTTCARILAKVLNCQDRTPDFEACNTCSSCTSFNENASFNIIELDAASNNSVEHIRALTEQVRFQPQQGKYKIFIIDEVHMLSQQAFNAFLKTLEEPPPYAIFILATTEKHKIIPTILSRCQIFDFRRIQIPDMVAHLERICAQEGISAEQGALHIIAQKADGALRDALSIFDRIVSFSGNHISYQDVIANLNVLDYDYFFKMMDALLLSDMPAALNILDDVLKKGFDAEAFINGLAEHIRNLLVCKSPASVQLLEVGDGLQQRYLEQAALAPQGLLLTALGIANECDLGFKMARNKRLHVEMAVIKMCYIQQAIESVQQPAPVLEKKKPEPLKKANEPRAYQKTDAPPLVAKEASNAKEVSLNSGLSSVVFSKVKANDKFVSPKITSIKDIEHQVKEQQQQSYAERETNLEQLRTVWYEYAEQVESKLTRNYLMNADLEFSDKTLTAVVGSSIAEGSIRSENNLMPFLCERVGVRDLIFTVRLDVSRLPSNEAVPVAKPLTNRDVYEQMKEKKPLLEDLAKRFDLRFE
jgi:DNA polymerase-3 subunit gamma/tau